MTELTMNVMPKSKLKAAPPHGTLWQDPNNPSPDLISVTVLVNGGGFSGTYNIPPSAPAHVAVLVLENGQYTNLKEILDKGNCRIKITIDDNGTVVVPPTFEQL